MLHIARGASLLSHHNRALRAIELELFSPQRELYRRPKASITIDNVPISTAERKVATQVNYLIDPHSKETKGEVGVGRLELFTKCETCPHANFFFFAISARSLSRRIFTILFHFLTFLWLTQKTQF